MAPLLIRHCANCSAPAGNAQNAAIPLDVCQESQPEHRQQPVFAQDVPSTPWTKVASDMFQIKGDNYLLVNDYHSKFYLVEKMQSTTSTAIANKSAQWFSMFGPPLEIVTSNGPQYVGQPYEDMCSKWNIKHTTTSPRHRQSNDVIETQVRTVEGVIQKCAKTGNDMLIALQQHRCTPLDSNLSSPSEILFNRPIRITLPTHHPTLMHQNQQLPNEQLQQRRDRMIRYHDQRAGPELPVLHAGQRVTILNKETHLWSPGEIVSKCAEPRSYIVKTTNGTMLRRTRAHLRALQSENIHNEATEHTRRRVTFREHNRWRRLSRRLANHLPMKRRR